MFVPLTLDGGNYGQEEKSEESSEEKEEEESSKEESQGKVEACKEKSGQEKACAKKGEAQEEDGHETSGADVRSGGAIPFKPGSIRGENRPEPGGRVALSHRLKALSGLRMDCGQPGAFPVRAEPQAFSWLVRLDADLSVYLEYVCCTAPTVFPATDL